MITETKPKGREAPEEQLLDEDDVARYLKLPVSHVRTLRSRKLLPYVLLGKAVRYRRADIERAVALHTVAAIGP